jgi:hypothetical protein
MKLLVIVRLETKAPRSLYRHTKEVDHSSASGIEIVNDRTVKSVLHGLNQFPISLQGVVLN